MVDMQEIRRASEVVADKGLRLTEQWQEGGDAAKVQVIRELLMSPTRAALAAGIAGCLQAVHGDEAAAAFIRSVMASEIATVLENTIIAEPLNREVA